MLDVPEGPSAPMPDSAPEFPKFLTPFAYENERQHAAMQTLLEPVLEAAEQATIREEALKLLEVLAKDKPLIFVAHEDADGQAAMAIMFHLRGLLCKQNDVTQEDRVVVMPVGLHQDYYKKQMASHGQDGNYFVIDMNDDWLHQLLQDTEVPITGKIDGILDHHNFLPDRAALKDVPDSKRAAAMVLSRETDKSVSSALLALLTARALIETPAGQLAEESYPALKQVLERLPQGEEPEKPNLDRAILGDRSLFRYQELALIGMIGDRMFTTEEILQYPQLATLAALGEQLNLLSVRPASDSALESYRATLARSIVRLSDSSVPLSPDIGADYAAKIQSTLDAYWQAMHEAASPDRAAESSATPESLAETRVQVGQSRLANGEVLAQVIIDQTDMKPDEQLLLTEAIWKQYLLKHISEVIPRCKHVLLGVTQANPTGSGVMLDVRAGHTHADDTYANALDIIKSAGLLNPGGHLVRAGGYAILELQEGVTYAEQAEALLQSMQSSVLRQSTE